MKKLIPLIALVFFIFGCNKDKDKGGSDLPITYINTNPGSLWMYHEVNSSDGTPESSDFTITSTPKDTSIQGKTFHIYAYSYGGFQYLNQTGSDYYQYDSLPGLGSPILRLYLKSKAKVGDTWDQTINVTIPGVPAAIPVKISNKVIEIGSHTVNGTAYNNVMHIQSSISSTLIPAANLQSSIDTYYAENYGLVESSVDIDLDYMGIVEKADINITLTSAVLK